ncbi:hypothetical protein GJ496_002477 [Pomphorhynchus laevis]|nr:hypothetical protein GJ496_002477 [Pomphorhynchus laevis]
MWVSQNDKHQRYQYGEVVNVYTSQLFGSAVLLSRNHKVLPRIPKGVIVCVAQSLDRILRNTINLKDEVSWTRLLCFCYWALRGQHRSCVYSESVILATKVKRQTEDFMISRIIFSISSELPVNKTLGHLISSEVHMEKRFAAKQVNEDVCGAVIIISSNKSMAPYDSNTLDLLLNKHLSQPANLSLPPPPYFNTPILVVTENDILGILKSFAPGFAVSADGLRPSHLVSLIERSRSFGASVLRRVSDFLTEKGRGFIPIKVACTLRRLACKSALKNTSYKVVTQLRPIQMGFATKIGLSTCLRIASACKICCTFCVHAQHTLLRLIFENSINSQAILITSHIGLGLRQLNDVALPAYLASLYSTESLVTPICARIDGLYLWAGLVHALDASRQLADNSFPEFRDIQKEWDIILNDLKLSSLYSNADQMCRARLNAAIQKESAHG